MSARSIAFAANAWMGKGGQGEFLRGMVRALDAGDQTAAIVSRSAQAKHAQCINLKFEGTNRRRLFDFVSGIPVLRGRGDWLNLLSDVDFDARAARVVPDVDLFDGVCGQCCRTFEAVSGKRTKRVLTCLNTHPEHMERIVRDEQSRIGFSGPTRMHRRMLDRSRREIEMADRVRVCSSFARETFLERGVPERKISVVQIGIDLDHFYPVPIAEDDPDPFRVLVVSSVEPRKGVHYALEAFERAALPNSLITVIGGTGDRWSKQMLESFQSRLPQVRQAHMDVMSAPVEQSYGAASVLVHSALEDGYGLVIPQALASGRPVIATRQSGAAELIEDGVNGFVVESRDVSALADRMSLLANDRHLLRRMSAAAPGSVSHLGYEQYGQRVRKLYEEIVAG
ncbi:MAG: glycosyltransferase family 4 protein [Anaerolineae bacterium]|nr:glycosyltransferase family 4 protein [Phycisphaerae bacterium]